MAFTVSRRQWGALSIVIFLLLVLILSVQARSLVEEDSKVGVDPRDSKRVARDPRFDKDRWDDGWDRGGWNDGGGWDEGGNWNDDGGWNNRPPWGRGGGGRKK